MPDRMTPEQRHECMSHIKSKDTRPEILVRRWLFSHGFRFRKNDKRLPGCPDIVLPKYRTVIFINGCFWHGHINCRIYVKPQSNCEFWEEKIHRNMLRDARNQAHLAALNWYVITIWECELRNNSFERTMKDTCDRIRHNADLWQEECLDIKRRKQYSRFKLILEKEKERLLLEETMAQIENLQVFQL